MHISIIDTSSLGDRSYLVSDGGTAVVIDPQRDIDRVLTLAEGSGVTITHVLETHVHNDYVTGGLELSRTVGAEYVVPAGDDVAYDRRRPRTVRSSTRAPSNCRSSTLLATPTTTSAMCCAIPGAPSMESSPVARCCTAPLGGRTSSAPNTPRS